MSNVKNLDISNFEQEIKTGIVVIDFWAPWCGPCLTQAHILEQMAPKVIGKATVAKVNVDSTADIASKFDIRGIPTIIIFKDGVPVKKFTGVQLEKTLLAAIQEATI